jgi:carotenoid cleavage dioxygenase
VVDASGALVRTEDIDIGGPSMVHDFAITQRHVVFFDLPVVYDLNLLGQQPFPAEWKPDYGARVGVMPRDGGNADVEWLDVDLCYVFHPLNAYDDGDGRVVVDVVRHPRMFATDRYGPAEEPPTLDRWTIDTAAGKVVEERLDDHPQELPRVDPRVVGRRHRYGYAPHTPKFHDGEVNFTGILKHDLDAGTTAVRDLGPGMHAGEAVFVPAGPDAGEDEGWVMAVVYDEARDGSDLLIVDGRDFTGREIARVRLPQRVPFGFHGSWVGDDEL